jgi:NAD(P)-dependent dehydrogenase (short-subunit alcohol dehydrogenase family)
LIAALAESGERCSIELMSGPNDLPYGRDALRGRVAVVAGATRGAGRGIAAALGEAGATVICTGRSSTQRNLKSDYDRIETIEETAELVTELGGKGIAIPIDHLVPDEVKIGPAS